MNRKLVVAFLSIALCAATALSQTTSSQPSAWVYASAYVGTTSQTQIFAFTAAANGRLTPVSGSPFPDDLGNMAVNGLYLFGAPVGSGTDINTYRIESNGALSYAESMNSTTVNNCTQAPAELVLDHTGATLYGLTYFGDSGNCSNNTYQTYSINKSSGALTYIDTAGATDELNGNLTFTANNEYAYTSSCYHFNPQISGFKRNSNGALTEINPPQVWPAPASQFGCPYLAAADPTNHLAIPIQPYPEEYSNPSGPFKLASYTVQSNGNLTTTSTWATMPSVSVGNVTALAMSPSGKLLAVAGTTGLQVFHFNGANPITPYTGLLTTSEVGAIQWDNNNHLYAVVNATESNNTTDYRLAVFTVTPTSWTWVESYQLGAYSGSSYPTYGLAVQPLPLPWK